MKHGQKIDFHGITRDIRADVMCALAKMNIGDEKGACDILEVLATKCCLAEKAAKHADEIINKAAENGKQPA